MTGLYIHIPICIAKCRYCDFYKVTPREWDSNGLFLDCLEKEFSRLPKNFKPDTVFVGGGTPTALSAQEYGRMLEALHRHIDLSNVVEFTSEANPGTLTREKLEVMKAGGINRMSIGVQSFHPRALQLLGRVHDAETAIKGYHLLRECGFENVNIDLIQSIPGMKMENVLDDARQVVDLGPEHVSYYNLIYEPGTPLTKARDLGKVVPPGEDEEADNYFAVKDLLEQAGYDHYEISNFARKGRECLHNVLYWQGGEYFGCGPSAHSHWNGARFGNIPNLTTYCERLENGQKPFEELEILEPADKARETMVMWLRMTEGIDIPRFCESTGFGIDQLCGDGIDFLVKEGLLAKTGNRLALTREALFVCNAVFSELV